jgi:hypothetical protein
MAAGSNVVSLTYQADTKALVSDIRKGLATVSGMTEAEARKWAKSVDAGLKTIAKGAKGAETATKQGGAGLKAMGKAADEAGRNAQKLGGVLDLISPELGAIARNAGDVGDALDVIGGTGTALLGPIGAVTVAVAALGAAYLAVSGSIDRAAESQHVLAEISRSTEPLERRLEDAYIDQAVALGALTVAQGRQAQAAEDARRAVLDFAAAQEPQRAELEKTIATSERYLAVTRGLFALLPDGVQAITDQVNVARLAGDAYFGWTDSIEASRSAIGDLDGELLETAELQGTLREVTLATADATDRHAAATERSTEGLQRTSDLYADLRRREEERGAALLELAQIAESSQTSEAPRLDAIIAKRDAELYRIEELIAATGALEQGEAARLEVVRESAEAEAELRAGLVERLSEQQARAHEQDLRQIEQRRSAYIQAGSTITDSLGSIADAIQGAEGASEEQRLAAFRAAKGIAYASALINVAQGVTAALTLPPPLGPIAAVAVGAAGAVQIATIAATEPSFHQGGMVGDLAPDEIRGPRMTTGEGVLTARGVRSVGGPSAVQAANEGRSSGAASPQGSPQVIAVLTPPGSPTRILRDATRSQAGAAMVRSASRPSVLRTTR